MDNCRRERVSIFCRHVHTSERAISETTRLPFDLTSIWHDHNGWCLLDTSQTEKKKVKKETKHKRYSFSLHQISIVNW